MLLIGLLSIISKNTWEMLRENLLTRSYSPLNQTSQTGLFTHFLYKYHKKLIFFSPESITKMTGSMVFQKHFDLNHGIHDNQTISLHQTDTK